VIYYVASQLGGVVKIGTTVDLKSRLARLGRENPAVTLQVLATEPGGPSVEFERHRQFTKSHQRGEWYWLTPDLVAWIEGLK
jgi:hypothetical protein